MKSIELKDLAIDHDYYASDNNYFDRETVGKYNTWADFYEQFHDADIDMNLIYRWDIYKRPESNRYYMQINIIAQRKGFFMPVHIDYLDEKDVETIIPFMQKHWNKLQSIWQPISKIVS